MFQRIEYPFDSSLTLMFVAVFPKQKLSGHANSLVSELQFDSPIVRLLFGGTSQ